VGGQHHAPAALPPGKSRYPLYRRLGTGGWVGPRAGLDVYEKSRPHRDFLKCTGSFDPRTVQPVVSRYTD
jgi:hypothetical protein